ncbi:UNVERIFIED_CONTAM: hypothetical protein GTU68_034466 [Idotea baltica]|nr:hypothetical protein [Idotea baltica]
MDSAQLDSPFGEITISAYAGHVSALYFSASKDNVRLPIPARLKEKYGCDTPRENQRVLKKAQQQLTEYIRGERKEFELELAFEGSVFQESVWQELTEIPYAETISYLDLAKKVRSPKAFRAVGSANGKNAISIIIPCHRVIASNGNISGYAGGPETKARLLEHEKSYN